MPRFTPLLAACCALAALASLLPAPVAAAAGVRARYRALYERVDRRGAGPYRGGLAGRDLAADGVLTRHGPRPATRAELRAGIGVMRRMLHPPPPAPPAPASEPVAAPAAPSYGGSCGGITPYPGGGQCWAIPYSIVLCESGGQSVMNASGSTAGGYYQILGMDPGASKATQDAAAASMWDGGAGAGNWVCAG